MASTKTKCTVIIVDPKKGQSRSINISSPHIYNLKYYIGLLAFVLVVLITVCATLYTSAKLREQERISLVSTVRDLQQQLPKPTDTLDAKDYVQRIEAKLYKINEYLKKRGVKGFTQDAVGGDEHKELRLAPLEYYSLYDQYLEQVFEGLTYTPTGFPAKPELTSAYGYRSNPFHGGGGEFHAGIDFRGRKGDLVRSTASGEVTYAGRNGGYGICIQLKHKNGYETLYGHLSKCLVKEGEKIVAGQVIGQVGSTGRSTGSHLHYEVRKNGKPINPINFLRLD
ncbi:M23 family metallopeptidase [Parapedobacter koreensis]|uniref:Murein DD-endopeptidase MepM and murein hydrolase activator NlpD, contain LysM domain n=1 Tax=Parapedobacter koreensis TaxID=332977 RepID=A0A1H7NV79_9SPHI|nr:M23 family metallopeptidase [Parapedobacter koreensis]SEL26915.1 Murein DD-endopeptidase MepM and murein hydrolase activator NlpD, contain LysM domain [Parapedobacter koreensis]